MSLLPFLASELVVGNPANKIAISNDGSMTFEDFYIPAIRLRDIVSGNVVIDPALLVYIANTDPSWVAQPATFFGQTFYKTVITHNWGLTAGSDSENILPIGVEVTVWDCNNKKITIDDIQAFPNTVELTLNKPKTIKVSVKRIG